MRTTNWDAVAASSPLDTKASVIRDGSGEAWDGRVPEFVSHWKAPPVAESERPENTPDLTGRTVGRLTVIRYHRSKPKGGGAQWLVRCACGDYELRRSNAITHDKGNEEPCCAACDWLRLIKFKANAPSTQESREASAAALDRLASPSTCGQCASPSACFAEARCVAFQEVAA